VNPAVFVRQFNDFDSSTNTEEVCPPTYKKSEER
jgi:hypothetical protein